jgi:hypothetical protein
VIYWRTGPDGRKLIIRWLQDHSRWSVRRGGSMEWCESQRLGLALAAVTGDPVESGWIRELEAELDLTGGRA